MARGLLRPWRTICPPGASMRRRRITARALPSQWGWNEPAWAAEGVEMEPGDDTPWLSRTRIAVTTDPVGVELALRQAEEGIAILEPSPTTRRDQARARGLPPRLRPLDRQGAVARAAPAPLRSHRRSAGADGGRNADGARPSSCLNGCVHRLCDHTVAHPGAPTERSSWPCALRRAVCSVPSRNEPPSRTRSSGRSSLRLGRPRRGSGGVWGSIRITRLRRNGMPDRRCHEVRPVV